MALQRPEPGLEIFLHRQQRKNLAALRHEADAAPRPLIGLEAGDIDAIERGEKIVLIDDLLATGGTSASAAALIKKVGGVLLEAQFLIELEFLHGREKLTPVPVVSFLKY